MSTTWMVYDAQDYGPRTEDGRKKVGVKLRRDDEPVWFDPREVREFSKALNEFADQAERKP